MSATTNLAARLAETIGAQRVVDAAEELASFAVSGLTPSAIVRPRSAEEVAAVVRFAVADKLALLPLGSRSKCQVGMPPTRYDIAVDMTAMQEIAHYDAGDMTLSVDAGMPLRELEIQLKRKGQFLPLAVPCFESTTAGGTIASGIDSALRLQYGSARDFLIGAEFVDGAGQLCRSGGRVVKNVTGYDLHKLLVGSLGTLGVITRLNFRTFPLPPSYGGHLAQFSGVQEALAYRAALEKAGLPLADLEMFDSNVAEMIDAILERTPEGRPATLERGQWCVYCSYEGNETVVRRISGDIERIAREIGARRSEVLEKDADESLGGMLREAFEWLRWASPAVLIYRLALPEVTAELLARLSQIAESVSLRNALLVRAPGIVYCTVLAEFEDDDAMIAMTEVVADVSGLARAKKGHATLLHAPLTIQRKATVLQAGAQELGLGQRVKRAFDPAGVFAPGRVVGGL
jgi:FAD/FMN-containing dehydrogenase